MMPEQAASLTAHLAEKTVEPPCPRLELELWAVLDKYGVVSITYSEAAARNDAWTGDKVVKLIAREAE